MKTTLSNKKIVQFFFLALTLFFAESSFSANRYSVATGNWNATSTWSDTSGGTAGFSAPVAGDVVYIERGFTVTVNVTSACTSIQLGRLGTAGAGTLTFSGSSTLTVSGAVVLGNNITGSTGIITFTSGSTLIAGSLQLGGSVTGATGTITMTLGGTLRLGGALTVGTGIGTWTQGIGAVEFTATNTLPATIFTTFNNLTISGGKTTTGRALTIASLSVKSAAAFSLGHAVTATATALEGGCAVTGASITGASTLTLGGNVTVTDNTGGTAGATISCPVSLSTTTRTFTVADDGTAAADLTVSGIISTAAGITKAGAGTMVLSGANTYSGLTTVSVGTLALGVSSTVSTAGPLGTTGTGTTVSSGAALDLNGFSLTSAATEALSLNGSGIASGGALTNSSNTASNYIGLITLPSAAASIITNAGDINLTNTGALTADSFILTIGGTGTGSIAGAFTTNSNGITKTGTGTWTVSGNSTYGGPTLISEGTLKLGSTTALGSVNGIVTVSNGGALDLKGFTLTAAKSTTINGTGVSSLGAITNSSLTGATYSGAIVLGSNSSIVGETGSIAISNTGQMTGAGFTLTLGGTTGGSFSATLTTGTGGLTKIGTGTWTINTVNYYNGATTISAGTLKLGVGVTGNTPDRGPLGSNVSGTTIAAGAVLDLNGNSIDTSSTPEAVTINGTGLTASPAGALTNTGGSATFNGAITLGSASTITATSSGSLTCSGAVSGTYNLTLDGAGTGTMSGSIGIAAGALTKNGAGTWTLSGANTYSGGTTVSAGILGINSTTALGATTGSLTISSGAKANVVSNVTVGSLTLNGLGTSGTWGSSTSAATNKDNTYFTSTGIVTVTNDTRTTPTVTVTVGTYTYSGSAQGPNAATNTGTGTSYTYSYAGVPPTVYAESATAPSKAGTYTATATVAANGNYKSASSSATAFTIGQKALTISNTFATNKVYDGTTAATINSDLATLTGVVSPDAVSINNSVDAGTFVSANVGTGIAVTASGFSLSGTDAGNYTVTQPTGLSANITAKAITIYANNINKCLGSTYTFAGNEFTTSSQESGLTLSSVTLTSTGTISSAALGSYTIAASNATGTGLGNYTISYVSGTLTVTTSPATTGVSICPGGSGALTSSVTCISAPILGGVKNPGAVVNTTSIGNVAWSNPSNALTNNATTASITLADAGKVSNYLMSSNHSFAIPSNAIIQGINVTINKYASNIVTVTQLKDNEVKLVKAGTVVGDNKANTGAAWPQTEQASTYGSPIDLWGTSWTAADINNANFGVALSVKNTAVLYYVQYSGEVDDITIEVTYGLPGTLNWYTASSGGTAIGSGSSFNPVGVVGSSLVNTNTPGTTTFYAECSSLPGCRTATDFVINANPAAPTATNNTKTYTGIANTTSISATPQASQTIDWYQDATGGSPLLSGSTTYIPTAVNVGTYTFYAAARTPSLDCTSTTRTAVTLTITKALLTITANDQSVSFKTAVVSVLSAGTYTASGLVNGETASVISGTVTYTTTYTATTNAGTPGVTITPNISGLTAANYSFGTVANGTITIDNATPIVTPIIGSYTYTGVSQGPNSATNTGTGATYTYSYVGVSGTSYTASATPPKAVGSYTVTATVAADGNYATASSTPTAFTIGKAVLTITANNNAVSFGVTVASVTGAGTYTASGFLNGETASVISGAATYTTTYTTTTALGTAGVTITPNVSGLSAANYSFVGANGTIVINNKTTPTISATIGTYTYTGLSQGPNTATNSGTGSTYTYSYSGSGSTVYGPSATLPTVAGSYTVKVAVAASIDGVYNAVTSAETAFTINKATLTLTASNANKTYGTVKSTLVSGSTAYTITSGSLKNGETIGSVTLSYGTGALAATDAVGNTSVITPSAATGGTFSINNYTITYSTGTLTVTTLAITVTATGPSKIYGTALTTGTSTSNFTVTGTLPSGQALTSVTLTPNANGLSATTAAGTAYAVTPSLATGTGGFLASNYTITYSNYSGTVATKALTITATDVSKVYGDVITTPETGSILFTTSGLVGSETVGSVTLNYGSGASATTVVGTYASAVVPSAATGGTFAAANYTITYVSGTTTVTKAALTVTAQDQSKCFGANVVFFGDEFLSAGLKNSDVVTTVSSSSTASSTATVSGTYAITPSAAVGTGLSNYTITYVDGTFTVISSPAPTLSVTPASATVCSGTAVDIVATISGGSPNKVFTGVNNTGVNIPNNSSNSVSTSANSTIALSDATAATVSSASVISVQFSISHTSVQELDVYLVDPSGTRGMLLTANNGGSGDNYTNTIIRTSATNVIGSTGNNTAPFTNTYAPEGGISTIPATNTQSGSNNGSYSTANIGSLALNGATINGTWSIKVFDTSGSTTGRLDNWTLTITNPGVYTSVLVGPTTTEVITATGTNNENAAITMTPPAGVNNFYVETTDAIGCSNISSAIVTTVNTAPAITVQPAAPAAVCAGNGIRTISVTATGAGLTYSWRKAGVAVTNGGVISGQGTATLTLTNPIAADAGSYNVVITGTCSPTATSSAVTLTVNPNLPASVSIASSDIDNTFCSGSSVTFTASTTNGGTPSYQWKVNGTNVGTNSITYATTSLANNDVVSVVMTSTATCATGSPATSNTITNTVNPILAASVSIVSSDLDNSLCLGTSVTFTATPTNGGTAPSYQWKVNGANVGTNSTTFTSTTLANNDAVTVVMTSNATPCLTGSQATSNSISTVVNPNVVASVSVSSSDADNSICSGTSVTFTATPTNGGSAPIYVWKLNGINVGTNSATYTTAALTNNDQITVLMTSNANCVSGSPATSNTITTTVNPYVTASVSMVSNDADNTICSGTSVTFTATPTNGGTPSYQWKLNGVNAGTNSATYTTTTLANNDAVSVVMTTTATCATSSTATSNSITTTVNPNLPASVSVGASATTICTGTNVTFTATPTNGGAAPSYQWKLNGTDVGSNSATYASTALTNGNTVTVVMTSNATPCLTSSPATSNTVTMTVNPNLPASVSIAASATTICSGVSVTFTATPNNGGTAPAYQWKLNGTNVGSNSATYTSTTLANGNTVTVVMTSNATPCLTSSPATSNTVTMTVTANNTVSLSSAVGTNAQTKCINTAITAITYATTGATNATFTGLPAGVSGLWAANLATISGTPTASGTFNYTITLTGGCGTVTAAGTITVKANNTVSLDINSGPKNQTLCIGDRITYIEFLTTGATGATFTGLPAGVYGNWVGDVAAIDGIPTESGTFNYTVTLTGGCGTVTATGTFTVTADNTVSLSSAVGTDAQTKCINTAITTITYVTTGATGATFLGLPDGVSGLWVGNLATISGTPTESGTFGYTVDLTGGCGTITATGTITVTANNTVSLSSAVGTNAQTKCINTAITTITYATTGATGATFSGLPAGVTGSWVGDVATISGTPTASGTFNYTITLTGGCGTVTGTGTITVTPASIGGSVAGSGAVCTGTNSKGLTLSGHTGTITSWESSLDNFNTAGTTIANTTTTLTATNLTVATYYRAVITNGLCAAANSATATITINPRPIIANKTVATCSGVGFSVAPTNGTDLVPSPTRYSWTAANNVNVSGISSGFDLATINGTLVNNSSSSQTVVYTVVPTATTGLCDGASFTVTVAVDPTTVAGSVAGGTTICSGSTSALLTLSGHTGTISKWQSAVSPFSTWTDIANTATTYTSGALTATTQFRAVVQSGSCAAANSVVTTVTVSPTTVAGSVAGGTTICSGSTSALLTLSGHTGTISKWQSAVSPFSTWTDIANTAATYTSGALTATTQFRAVVQSGSCAAANSVVTTVTVDPTTVAGSVAGGTTICSGSTSALLTLSGHTGTISKWQSAVSPFSTWTDIANTAATYTCGALTATTQFRAVVQSGSCAAANSVVTTVTVSPTTVAGSV
ncbi:beta strand repeat-containing protein, partial [Flavobacterium luteum]